MRDRGRGTQSTGSAQTRLQTRPAATGGGFRKVRVVAGSGRAEAIPDRPLRSRDRAGYTAPMNPRPSSPPVLFAVATALMLAGCGNKGPLVQAPAPVDDPQMPASVVPVKVEPQLTLPAAEPEGALRDPTAADPLLVDPVTGPPAPPAELPIDPTTVPYPAPEPDDSDPESESATTDPDPDDG